MISIKIYTVTVIGNVFTKFSLKILSVKWFRALFWQTLPGMIIGEKSCYRTEFFTFFSPLSTKQHRLFVEGMRHISVVHSKIMKIKFSLFVIKILISTFYDQRIIYNYLCKRLLCTFRMLISSSPKNISTCSFNTIKRYVIIKLMLSNYTWRYN